MTTLLDLLGAVDNLDEAPGILNHQSGILGIVISFMVCGIVDCS